MVVEIEKEEGYKEYERLIQLRKKYGAQKFPDKIVRTEDEIKKYIEKQSKLDAAARKRDLAKDFRLLRNKIIIDTGIDLPKKERSKKKKPEVIKKNQRKRVPKKPVKRNVRKTTTNSRKKKQRKLNVKYKIRGVYFYQTDIVYNSKEKAKEDAKKLRKSNNRARVVPWDASGKQEYYIYMRKGLKN